MEFTVDYPVVVEDYDPALITPAGMTRVAKAIEDNGFDAVAFTEHPAPSYKWLSTGGHVSLDQTAALAFCAAVTSRIRLMPYLMVVPYHNPFVAAKALATIDQLSGGRLTVVVGTGYLRSEFRALNIDFEQRNEIFDEALEVMRGAWTEVPFHHEGQHFRAMGVASVPGPLQPGGPPILVGGNSGLSRRRAAALQGWSPLVRDGIAATTRTPGISTIAQLATQISAVRAAATELGTPETTIQAHTAHINVMHQPGSVEEHRDHLGELAAAGVDRFVVRPPGTAIEGTVEALQEYAETYLS